MLIQIGGQDQILLLGALGMFAVVLIGLVVVAVMTARSRRALGAGLDRLFEQIDLSLHQLRSQSKLMERLDSRAQVRQIGTNNEKSFEAAVRMARTGASTDQLTANSGLTKQEARLLTRLHGPEKAQAV